MPSPVLAVKTKKVKIKAKIKGAIQNHRSLFRWYESKNKNLKTKNLQTFIDKKFNLSPKALF